MGPGQCGSVGWSIVPSPKGCKFDSQSRHIPRSQVPSQVQAHMGASINVSLSHRCFSLSLPPSLPLSLKEMKKKKSSGENKKKRNGFLGLVCGNMCVCRIGHGLFFLPVPFPHKLFSHSVCVSFKPAFSAPLIYKPPWGT